MTLQLSKTAMRIFLTAGIISLTGCFDDDRSKAQPAEFANAVYEVERLAGSVLRDTTRIALMAEDVNDLCDDGGSAQYMPVTSTSYRLDFDQCRSRNFANSEGTEVLLLNGGFRVEEEDSTGAPPVWTINTGGGTSAFFLNYRDDNSISYTLQGGYLFAEESVQGYAMTIPEVILERRYHAADADLPQLQTLTVRMPQIISDVGDADSVVAALAWGLEGSGVRVGGRCGTAGFSITTTDRVAGISAEYEMKIHNTEATVTRTAGSLDVETEHGDSAGYTDGDLASLCQ